MELSVVIARLHKHGQKATYGAVGGVTGRLARGVMQGQPKLPRNSWVVAKKTGLPTGYSPAETDSRLQPHAPAIDSPEQLRAWLVAHP